MKRYFFDIRDGDNLAVDEEGMDCRTLKRRKRRRRDPLPT
jgi:hypothetical protein